MSQDGKCECVGALRIDGGMVAGLGGQADLGYLWSTGPGPPDSAANDVVFGRVSSRGVI